jgi:hypothetical protein
VPAVKAAARVTGEPIVPPEATATHEPVSSLNTNVVAETDNRANLNEKASTHF